VKLGPREAQENTGSVARDHLANERTFLAWIRTSLAVIGLGVLVGKLIETDGLAAEVIGIAMVGFGAVMLVYSIGRYERTLALLNKGLFSAARWGPIIVAVLGVLVAIGALVLLLT
jgi:putative membrane protein